jgi:multiple sugar transport system substrate-binding protein
LSHRACARGTLRLLLVAAALAVAGCGARHDDPNVVRFWAMGREGEVVAQLVPDFQRAHPGIRVEVQQLPWTAAHEKLLTAFAGDSTPDLCQLGNTWVPEFAALRALEPLDARVAASSVIAPADYFAGIWDTNRVGATLYGVPWYVDTRLLFYRRDLLAQAGYAAPPRAWPEWLAMLQAIEDRHVPRRKGIVLPANEFEPLVALALQQDDPLLRDGGRYGNFRSAGFGRALELYAGMFRNGYAAAPSVSDASNIWNEFGRGNFVFYISGPWNIGELKRRLPQSLQQSWMTAPLPGPDGPGASIAGGSSLVLFRASHAKAAAWQLIEYLSRPDVQQRFHALTGDLPPRRSAWHAGDLADDVYARAFRDQLERVKPTPRVPEWERIANEIRLVAERVVDGKLSVAEAQQELDARTDRILEKRRSLLAQGNGP